MKTPRRPHPVFVACLLMVMQTMLRCSVLAEGDNFNDNSKDATRWGTDVVGGFGVLNETNQRLEYTCATPSIPDDSMDRPWVLRRFPYNADWEIQIDTFNSTSPSTAFQVNSFGFLVYSPLTTMNNISAELYSSALGGGPARNGFDTNLDTNDVTVATTDTGDTGVTNGAVRMVFTAATKVITVFYDTDVSDGYQWIQYGSFGISAAGGGTDGNTDWGISDTGQFSVFVYGFSQGMIITGGQMFGDNFMETGGVAPVGPPSPVPSGSYHFAFPVNNPLLTAIVSVTGNYQGVTPEMFSMNRNYDVDVAQDSTGHLMAMGTMDGVLGTGGNPEIMQSVGSITTMNAEPTAQVSLNFTGTRDGVNTTFTGNAQTPVEVIDVGGGTDGVSGTASYNTTFGGVPLAATNVPFQEAAPPGAVDNLKKDWSIELDLAQKGRSTKKVQVSARLMLPNGVTVTFKSKSAKIANNTISSLVLSKGTSSATNKKDKLTTVTITGLTFAVQGGVWTPTGGTISYSFLGQQGTANLTDFIITGP